METATDELTEEKITEGLQRPDAEVVSDDKEEPHFERRRRHRPFETQKNGRRVDDDLHEEEDEEKRPVGWRRTVLLLLALLIFLAVVIGGLVLFFSRNRNEMQVGSRDPRVGDSRLQAESQKQADEALKAVTESATLPQGKPSPEARSAGDLSQQVAPDPLAATNYGPNTVSPYAQPPAPATSGSQPDTTAASPSGAATVANALPPTAQPSDPTPQGISYYFFRHDEGSAGAPLSRPAAPQQETLQLPDVGVVRLPRSPTASEPVKPPFGTLLSVRLLDSVMTLREGGVIRLETTRVVSGAGGWNIPRGTQLVARVAGGNNNRAFLNVVGFIDAATNRLVNVGGEIKGTDGAPGLRGERKRAASRWSSAVRELGRAGVSLGSAFLIGRNGGGGYYPPPSAYGVPSNTSSPSQNANLDFIQVPAGAQGFVMITELPQSVEGRDAETLLNATGEMSDDELAKLLTDGTPEQIRAARPRMNPELQRLADTILAQEEKRGGGTK